MQFDLLSNTLLCLLYRKHKIKCKTNTALVGGFNLTVSMAQLQWEVKSNRQNSGL
jgi:hypothetical protein